VPSVSLAGLAAIIMTVGCSAPSSPDVQAALASVDQARGDPVSATIGFDCTSENGAEVEDAPLICSEVLAALTEARPDLRFVSGGSSARSAKFTITYATSRGLGLEATWVDAGGAITTGRPLSVSFFDRSSDPILRSNFYTAFLRENPIPF